MPNRWCRYVPFHPLVKSLRTSIKSIIHWFILFKPPFFRSKSIIHWFRPPFLSIFQAGLPFASPNETAPQSAVEDVPSEAETAEVQEPRGPRPPGFVGVFRSRLVPHSYIAKLTHITWLTRAYGDDQKSLIGNYKPWGFSIEEYLTLYPMTWTEEIVSTTIKCWRYADSTTRSSTSTRHRGTFTCGWFQRRS